MTQPNRKPVAPASYARGGSYKRATAGRQAPPTNPANTRLITGIILLVALVAAVIALFKPFAARTEYLIVTAPATSTTADMVKKALTDTGSLPNPNAVVVNQESGTFHIASADPKNALTTDAWQALATALPGKLPGAKVEYHADKPGPVNLGLDLKGGLRVVLGAQTSSPSRDDMERVRTIIENRVNSTGVAEPLVQIQGNRQVVVELPGLSAAGQAQVMRLIGTTARLEFRVVKDASSGKQDQSMTLADLGPVGLTGETVKTASATFDQFGRPEVQMEFNPQGATQLAALTGNNVGKRMAIVLDTKVVTAPTIQSQIGGGSGVINNIGTVQEASEIALVLRSGALPFSIAAEEIRAIGPALGQDAIRSGLLASLIGIGAIIVLVYVYYGIFFGTVAALGLAFSALLIFGVLSGLGAALTMPGIAGLVLTIGAAVDGNVISFERIKEELHAGKGLKASIRAGFGHSLATILDVNLSHLLSALALYAYSTGAVKGFAVTLAVGVIATVFSNLVFSHWMLEQMASFRTFKARHWFDVPKFDFMGIAKYVTTASLILAVAGAVIIGVKGFSYGVDFTSGSAIDIRTNTGVTTEDVRAAVDKAAVKGVNGSGASIIETQQVGSAGKDFTVRVPQLRNQDDQSKMETALRALPGGDKPNFGIIQVNTVGPAVGNELRTKTTWAVLVALGLILIYVAFRFDPVFGVGSVVAVFHDVLIVMGLFTLEGREFSITTVAAILTLIGYSLNDSIIVSDRIRENIKVMRGHHFAEIVNTSINQTLSRTVMTSVATMLPLIALLLLGGPVLRDFSLALLVGIIVGTYSSIYIVSPMVVLYKEWQLRRRLNQPEASDDEGAPQAM